MPGVASSLLFRKLSSLWQNYTQQNTNQIEVSNLTECEFERLAADLGVEPGALRLLCTPGEDMKKVLDFRFKQFGISRDGLDFATLGEMHLHCRRCASKGVCKYDMKMGRINNPCPADCPNLATFQKLRAAA
jgi:hypothetical protein